jgi:hypothetical protein
MAEAGIFIGWGANVVGREEKGLVVFNEAIQYWGGLQESGKIESFEVVLLNPHGGDLDGFSLLRGSQDQMSALLVDEEFERQTTRATLIVQNVGVVPAILGEGLGRSIGIYQQQIGELT